jgi:hypothetical protein
LRRGDAMPDVWKPVVGFEKYYSVSNNGDILSHRTGKLRKPVLCKGNGYFTVVLNGDNKLKETKTVHRMVAEAFLERSPEQTCVNHKNECKTDNRVDNLEWCTKHYNNTYNGKDQRCCKPVVQINETTGEEKRWVSARAAYAAGIAEYKNISACCRGLRPRAGGYKWRFE